MQQLVRRSVLAIFLATLVGCGSSASNASDAETTAEVETGSAPSVALAPGSPAPAPASADPTGLGSTSEPVTTAPAEPAAERPMPHRGVNLAGAEFGSAIPGTDGIDYRFPTTDEVDHFLSRGMNTFRIGFKWERIQAAAYGELDVAYAAKLDALVTYATGKGATVILNPHNFARYYDQVIGSSAVPNGVFADFWKRMASRYAGNAKVMFNLVNEPHDLPTEQWVSAANAAIAGIRSVGATNTIVVPGNAWTGAHAWSASYYGTPNAVAMLAIDDPADKVLFEVHQYLDSSSGGKEGSCVSPTIGSERLAGWIDWLRANGKKGFVGELAGGDNATCDAAVKDMLGTMMKSTDVLVGFTYWAAGPRWAKDYIFAMEPVNGEDTPQMKRLIPYL